MQFREALDMLEKSSAYLDWRKEFEKPFLAHGFYLDDELNKGQWQIGYYNKDNDKITTFFVSSDTVTLSEQSEVFKKPDAVVEPLQLDQLKITSDQAYAQAKNLAKEKYSSDMVQKVFMIVQQLEGKDVYNITLLTATMKTINIRIDAVTGEVLLEKVTNLMEFRAG